MLTLKLQYVVIQRGAPGFTYISIGRTVNVLANNLGHAYSVPTYANMCCWTLHADF